MKSSQYLEYRMSTLQFYTLIFCGIWCPSGWKSFTKLFYNIYTLIMAFSGLTFWLTIFINLIVSKNKSHNYYKNIFNITASTFAVYKQIFVFIRRKQIQHLLKLSFKEKWYEPHNAYENKIIEKYNYEIRWVTQVYAISIIVGLLTKSITPILNPNSTWELPIEAWYPYETDNFFNYYLSYTQQIFGGVPLMCFHISIDSLFVGLTLQMCNKLKLLQYRLKTCKLIHSSVYKNKDMQNNRTKPDVMIAEYVSKHVCILRFGKYMNKMFKGIMAGQALVTIPNICINVYLLSQHQKGFTFDLIDTLFSFLTCFIQIFLYCWYGNQITIHSCDVANAVYRMNWLSLNITSKKKLLMIMTRADQSIQFSIGTFRMNMNTFIEVLKISYSAYNVLQRISR